MRTLYIVPTPIGNLEDITLRALSVLKRVNLIAAEDTRVSRKLLSHFEITKPLISYYEQNELARIDQILEVLKEGDVALISDAGTPGISDPGYKLIKRTIEEGFTIEALPGPTAVIPAVVASGLPTDTFTFLGFLPKKSTARKDVLEKWKQLPTTLVIYESPYRILETLEDMISILGDRPVSIARELSKKFETYYRMKLSEAIEFFSEYQVPGEMVVVVGFDQNASLPEASEADLKTQLKQLVRGGIPLSTAAKQLAKATGKKKSEIYQLGLEKK